MAKFDNYEVDILDNLRNTPYTPPTIVYLGLYSTDPTDADSGTELAGNGYARQAVTFGAPTSGAGSITNTNTVTFTAAGGNWTTATHGALREAITVGDGMYHGALAAPRQANDGDSIVFDPGTIVVTES